VNRAARIRGLAPAGAIFCPEPRRKRWELGLRLEPVWSCWARDVCGVWVTTRSFGPS
jgi:hypothetical protein